MADIGGYLGLFLGLSVFGVVEMISGFIGERKRNKKRANDGHRRRSMGSVSFVSIGGEPVVVPKLVPGRRHSVDTKY